MSAAENVNRWPARSATAGRIVRGGLLAGALFALTTGWAADPAGGIVERPLAPRPGPRGATLFTLMPPAITGVVTDIRTIL